MISDDVLLNAVREGYVPHVLKKTAIVAAKETGNEIGTRRMA